MTKKSDRENRLAVELDKAGLLVPLMNVMVEQIEQESKSKKRKASEPSAAREEFRRFFPHYSDEMLDRLEDEY